MTVVGGAASLELDGDRLADLALTDRTRDLRGGGGLRAVDGDETVALANAGLLGGRSADDMLDGHSDVTARVHLHAEPRRGGQAGRDRSRCGWSGGTSRAAGLTCACFHETVARATPAANPTARRNARAISLA